MSKNTYNNYCSLMSQLSYMIDSVQKTIINNYNSELLSDIYICVCGEYNDRVFVDVEYNDGTYNRIYDTFSIDNFNCKFNANIQL